MKISIIGLGWFGTALARTLKSQHKIFGTTRSQEKIHAFAQENIHARQLDSSKIPDQELLNSDVVVLNVPPFEGQKSWFMQWGWNKNSHVIFISSTSVYGKNSGLITETTQPLP